MQCDSCNKWNHTDCEIERNNNLDLKQALADEKEIPYFCTTCSKSMKASKPSKQTKMVTLNHEDVQMHDLSHNSQDNSKKEENPEVKITAN